MNQKCNKCGKYIIYYGTAGTGEMCDCDKRERERLEKIIEARLQICQEVNGLPYCKNCGLCPEDIKGRNY
jgi:trimethylamine:corrinoid methyltransferase-like protein